MKILMVTNTYLPIVGGLEKSIQSFTKKFQDWGHDVMIVMPDTEKMHQRIKAFQPDVIHVHHPFLMGEIALRWAARYTKPLVFTYHIMFDQYSHYLPVSTPLAKRFLVELAVGFCNLSTQVIAPSESVREILRWQGVTTPIEVVPTGVEVGFFTQGNGKKMRQSLGIPDQAFVLGYIGRIAPEKNLEFLANVILRVMQEDENAHFVMAGKGPSEESLKKIFFDADLQNRLHVPGILQQKDLVDCYHAMDVFVFASQSETQGMVLCEAMAAGIPVVAVDAPGVREVVRDGENGRLLSYENEHEFQTALSWCREQPEPVWQRLKENARQTAENFSVDRSARRALEVYEIARRNHAISESAKPWRRFVGRPATEFNIMANLGRATGLALKEMVMARSGGNGR
ncbi:MAG: glycosyltransferase [Candidatus Omnitrophica bacterium]|nr:glycosyltransferase [Candidatus Omnitrophota bacterium]